MWANLSKFYYTWEEYEKEEIIEKLKLSPKNYIKQEKNKYLEIIELLEELNLEVNECWVILIERRDVNKENINLNLKDYDLNGLINELQKDYIKKIIWNNYEIKWRKSNRIKEKEFIEEYISDIKKELLELIRDPSNKVKKIINIWERLLKDKWLKSNEVKLARKRIKEYVNIKIRDRDIELKVEK